MQQTEQGRVQVPVVVTNVEASARLVSASNEIVKIEIPVQHGKGQQEGIILAQALQIFRQLGGFVVDATGNLEFYPITAFIPPFKFEIKRVSLITSGV